MTRHPWIVAACALPVAADLLACARAGARAAAVPDELLRHQRGDRQRRPISAAWREPTPIASGSPRRSGRRQNLARLSEHPGPARSARRQCARCIGQGPWHNSKKLPIA